MVMALIHAPVASVSTAASRFVPDQRVVQSGVPIRLSASRDSVTPETWERIHTKLHAELICERILRNI